MERGNTVTIWMKDKKWRKKVKDQNIFLMRDHNYAFAAWEIARLRGILTEKATLIHVDSHLDDVPDAVAYPDLFQDIKTEEQAIELASPRESSSTPPEHTCMGIDNFIWPAIVRNTIKNVYYICDQKQEHISKEMLSNLVKNPISHDERSLERNKFLLNHLNQNGNKIYRYDSLDDFKVHEKEFIEKSMGRKLILDLDLDFFNKPMMINEINLQSENKIRDDLLYLKNFVNWDVITVAISPEYSGGEEGSVYLLNLFLEIFNIYDKKFIDW